MILNCDNVFGSDVYKHVRRDIKILRSRMTKNMLRNIGDLFVKMYTASLKRPFVPSVGGIGLLCNV